MTLKKSPGNEIAVQEKEEIQRTNGEPIQEGVYFSPAVDIYEESDQITLVTDLPGVTKQGLDIDVEDGVLSIIGQMTIPDEQSHPIYHEYRLGGYMRRFNLGKEIDYQRMNASLKDGVLTLLLPKSDHLRPRKIQITTG